MLLAGSMIKDMVPLQTGPAWNRCNRCDCIGPRASGGPALWWLGRLFIFARYFLRTRISL